ncbi:T7SS effector LXG polymorphic toxin [Carnobacterium divergens]|uniref:T7SS effector LXG polymorphic toxin n=1 Tax=Carnobacterium divergens TaxID=2748 RepID=UPI0039AFF13C
MSIKMFVGEVNTQTNSITSYCTNVINGMTEIQTVLSKIILEPSLQGHTYDSAKNYFKTAYLPAIRGFILVCETAIRANQKLITDYKSKVDVNDLQEDVLMSQISCLDSMSTALDSIAIPKVFTQNIIDNLQEAKGKTAKKLTQLREFNHKSASIFEELEQQLQNLERGVTLIAEGKAWNGTTGTFSTAGLNMDWAQTIDQAWEERLKEQAKKDKPKKKKAKIPWWKKTMTGALDFLQGAGIAVVENNTGEKAKKVNQKFQNNQNYHYGKLFGTGLTGIQSLTEMYQGANMAIKGLQGIAGATVMSGGALAPGAGAIAGAGALAHGGLVFSNTIQNGMDNIQQMQSSGGGRVQPVGNMSEFFKSKFGKKLKDCSSKTSKMVDGQSVYKVNEKTKIPGLKKGDQFYLDGLHKDHIEVFDSNGNFRTVLNLDGSINVEKIKAAATRRLK